ncbi:MAG TPA: AI-2E family transporter [Candidatus Limnocylindrales bacterium]|jgi:predicted PurR-regulated permease PerM|nr:AI-2E family transporter [Candidatus Limnocylindrales bacterium]
MTESPRTKRLSLLFLVLLTAIVLYLGSIIARPFLMSIVTATVLAIALYPLFVRVRCRIRNGSGAALLVTLLVLFALLVPPVLLVNGVVHEITALHGWLNELQIPKGGWTEYITELVDRPLGWAAEKTGASEQQLKQAALDRLRNVAATLGEWAKSLPGNIGETIVNLATTLLTLFFLLRDGEGIRDGIGALLPIEPRRYQELVATISASVTANVYGVLAVAAAQGALGAIGYAIAGLPSVMLWSIATAAFSVVPVVGASCVWVVACCYLLAMGRWGMAIFMFAWGAGLISTADNIVRPLVLSDRVKLNTLLIFFALLGGVKAFGVVGLFVGPIIVSLAMVLLKMLGEERAEWESSPETPELPERH